MAREMVEEWFRRRTAEDPHGEYLLEQVAIDRAFRHYQALGMEGLMLVDAGQVLAVAGNCDWGIQQLSPQFPFYRKYRLETWEGREVFLTHGHRYSPRNPPPMGMARVMLSGHTHRPDFRQMGDLVCVNPGSVSLPRGGSPHSCLVWEDGLLRWLTLEGQEFHRERLP